MAATEILFTKKIEEPLLRRALLPFLSFKIQEVTRIKTIPVQPFDLEDYSLIFTSVNAVKSFIENGFWPDAKAMAPKHSNRFYAVGQKTEAELNKLGVSARVVFKNAQELSDFIVAHATQENFLHFCGTLVLNVLQKTLRRQHIAYQKITVYDTELLYPKIQEDFQAMVFFSPSGVRSFAKFNSLEGQKTFALGKTTAQELKKFYPAEIVTSSQNNLKDLLQLINQSFYSGVYLNNKL